VNNIVKEKNAILLNSGAATADLTGKACTLCERAALSQSAGCDGQQSA
jgi:hypothetical protein